MTHRSHHHHNSPHHDCGGCHDDCVDPCQNPHSQSDHLAYIGAALPCTGIDNCDTLTVVIQKIEAAICSLQSAVVTTTTSSSTTTTSTTAVPITTTTTTTCLGCTTTTTTTAACVGFPKTLGFSTIESGNACAMIITVNIWANNSDFCLSTLLYSNNNCTLETVAGWYSNGTCSKYWTGSPSYYFDTSELCSIEPHVGLGYDVSDSETACSKISLVNKWTEDPNFCHSDYLFSDDEWTLETVAGWYSNGICSRYWTGSFDYYFDTTDPCPATTTTTTTEEPTTTTTTTTLAPISWDVNLFSSVDEVCLAPSTDTVWTEGLYISAPLTIPKFYTTSALSVTYNPGADTIGYTDSGSIKYYATIDGSGNLSGNANCNVTTTTTTTLV